MMRRQMLPYAVLLYCFHCVQGASAQDITCTVTRQGNQTTYHLSESPPSHSCNYNWADISNIVLALKADEKNHDSNRVVEFTSDNITIHGCLKKLNYNMDCIGTKVALRRAHCVAVCTAEHTGEQKLIVKDPCCSVGVIVGICAVVLVLVIAMVIIFFVCKDKIYKLYGRIHKKVIGCCQPTPERHVGEPEPEPRRSCYIEVPEEEARV